MPERKPMPWRDAPPMSDHEKWAWTLRAELAQFASMFLSAEIRDGAGHDEAWAERRDPKKRAADAVALAAALQEEVNRARPRP